jgi:hypothetical protein
LEREPKGFRLEPNLILVFDVIIALIAIILSMLSLKTLKAIRHLGTGKSFWIPVFVSGVLFLTASVVTILNELSFPQMTSADEVVHASQLLALCALTCGIYGYSRRISKSLTEEFSIPERRAEESFAIEVPTRQSSQEESAEAQGVQGIKIQESSPEETIDMECTHQFGYLRTLRKGASIPDECLGCDKIIECKHSLAKTLESHAT